MHASGVIGSVTPRSVEELTADSGETGSAKGGVEDGGSRSSVEDGTATETQGATAALQVGQPSWLQNVRNAIPVEILAVWAAIESARGTDP